MKATIIIPTYWRGPASDTPPCGIESDYRFDYAVPLDEEGTLARALASLSVLEHDEELTAAIVAVPTRRELSQAVQLKVEAIMARFEYDVPIFLVGPDELVRWRRRLIREGHEEYREFLDFGGSAVIRNLCLLAAVLTGAEAAVFFDEGQVYRDPGYLKEALRFIGKEQDGGSVAGVSGYLRRPGATPRLPPASSRWQELWGDVGAINQAMKAVEQPPRLKKTTLTCGSNMVVHRSLFEHVPFDPRIPRGEETDYVMNAAFLGYDFFLDSGLWLEHQPRTACAPPWYRMRGDIVRFATGRAKLATQHDDSRRRRLEVSELDPYPGRFLKDDLHDLVMRSSLEMASAYIREGRDAEARECMSNIAISKAESRMQGDSFGEYMELQRRWERFIRAVPEMNIWHGGHVVD